MDRFSGKTMDKSAASYVSNKLEGHDIWYLKWKAQVNPGFLTFSAWTQLISKSLDLLGHVGTFWAPWLKEKVKKGHERTTNRPKITAAQQILKKVPFGALASTVPSRALEDSWGHSPHPRRIGYRLSVQGSNARHQQLHWLFKNLAERHLNFGPRQWHQQRMGSYS